MVCTRVSPNFLDMLYLSHGWEEKWEFSLHLPLLESVEGFILGIC